MRTQTLHQPDFAIAGVPLSAGALNGDGGDPVRRLFEHDGNEKRMLLFGRNSE